ncbi:ABC-2 transporter permease [Blautia schinkii]|nr:ABC-2 transporter permease [Blautia schinkii]
MRGLIRADYYMIKAEVKTYLILLGIFTILSFFRKSSDYIVTMQFVVTLMLSLSLMTIDENGKDAYYQQLPFDRRELVKEKYVRGFVFIVPFLIVGSFAGFIITLIYGADISNFFSEVVLSVVYLLQAMDFVIPICIKKEASKSRLLCGICVGVPSLVVTIVANVIIKDMHGINTELAFTLVMLVLVALALLLLPLSYRLSVKYYQAKEF